VSVRPRSVAVAALLCGIVAAVIVALVVPRRTEAGGPPATQAAKPIVVLPRRPVEPKRSMLQLIPVAGSVHVTAQMRDPLGGPAFAVRVFRATRLVLNGPHPRLGHGRLLSHDECAQLGRVYHGRFGWLDASRRFRPANFTYTDAPFLCEDHWRDARSAPQVKLTTLITDPNSSSAHQLESLAWGFGGGLTKKVALSGASHLTPKLGAEGAFLVRVPIGVRAAELQAHFEYEGRAPVAVPFGFAGGTRVPGTGRVRAIPGTAVIEARAPDPGGGLPWGVLGYQTSRGYCVTQPGRVVDDRVGTVDFVLGTFNDIWDVGRQCGASLDRLPPDWPAGFGAMIGGGLTPQSDDPTSDPTTGRTALRALPGRTVVYGVARPGVRQLTIESPRDVRTLIPSPRAHSFIVVYDGTFPTGKLTLTGTMADGSKKTVTQPAGFG
jgi:hypothetical protein